MLTWNSSLHKSRSILLLIANISFLVLYFILIWHSRIAHDDFYFLNNLEGKSILEATFQEYKTISARFPAVLLCYLTLKLFSITKAMFFLGILNLLLFQISIFMISVFLLWGLVKKNNKVRIKVHDIQSKDSSHFTNQHLRKGLNIEPQIFVDPVSHQN